MATTANQNFSDQQWMRMSPQLANYVNAIQTGNATSNRRTVTYDENVEGIQNQLLDASGTQIGSLDDVPGRDDIKSIRAYNQEAGGFHTLYVYVDPKTGRIAPIQDWSNQVTYGAPTNGTFFDQLASAAKTAAPYALAAAAAAATGGGSLAAEGAGGASALDAGMGTYGTAASMPAALGGGNAAAAAAAAAASAPAAGGASALDAGMGTYGTAAAMPEALGGGAGAAGMAGAMGGPDLVANAGAGAAGAALPAAAAAGTVTPSWMMPAAMVGSSLIGATAAQTAAMANISTNQKVYITVDPNGTILTTQGVFRLTVVYAQKV